MMRALGTVLVVVLLFFGLGSQAQVTTGTISGTVSDSTGAVLPEANVVILNEQTGAARTVTTDPAGRYSAPSLGLGKYRLTVSHEGFQTQVRDGIVLTLGREAIVNLALAVGAITQTVEVTGEAPLVETSGATVGSVVDDRTIRDLPLNGRDLTELILLNPGVTQATYAASDSPYTGFGRKFSISGFRGEDNAYFLDGTYINDYARHIPAGPSGALLGAETVREFEVLTNSYGAQYGRALGGVFNAVSRSGTNAWAASLYEYVRNSALDANRWEDNAFSGGEKPSFVRNQFGGTVGGPVMRDRAFFFLAYEGLRESLGSTQSATVPDLAARQGILPVVSGGVVTGTRTVNVSPLIRPYLDYPIFPAPTPGAFSSPRDATAEFIFQDTQPTREDFGQARYDHQFSDVDSFFARFTGSGADLSQVGSYPEFRSILIMNSRLLTLSETHIFSPRALSTTRFSFNRVDPREVGAYPEVPDHLLSVPGQPAPTLSPGSGISSWGGSPRPKSWYITNRFTLQEDADLTLGGAFFEVWRHVRAAPFQHEQSEPAARGLDLPKPRTVSARHAPAVPRHAAAVWHFGARIPPVVLRLVRSGQLESNAPSDAESGTSLGALFHTKRGQRPDCEPSLFYRYEDDCRPSLLAQ